MILPPPPAVVPQPERDAKGRWLPGRVSPNPKGRPVVPAELKKYARSVALDMLQVQVDIAMNPCEPAASRITATVAVLDRAYGKPVQQIEAGGPGAFEDLEDSELIGYAQRKAAELFRTPKIIDQITADAT